MRTTISSIGRRNVLGLAFGFTMLSMAALPVQEARAAETEVAALFTQTVTQGNWDPGGYKAFQAMARKYGYKPSYVEHASYEKAPAILRQLASRGVKMIICHSSGYSAAIQEMADEFPGTQFVLYSYADSAHGHKNYTAWSLDWDEYGYVVGALAAAASANKHIAIIAGEEIPSAKRAIEFTTRGAKAVAADVTVDTIFTGSFSDVAKAKEVATGVIARGADVILPSADTADAGSMQAADEEDAKTIGSYMDQSATYPNAVITSTELNFAKAYDEMGAMLRDGKLGGEVHTMNLANGGWTLTKPFKHVDPKVEETVFSTMDKVSKKEIKIDD